MAPSAGTWVDPNDGVEYNDVNVGFYVDTDETPEVIEWLVKYKETLKSRFDQKEISMAYTEINTI